MALFTRPFPALSRSRSGNPTGRAGLGPYLGSPGDPRKKEEREEREKRRKRKKRKRRGREERKEEGVSS